MFSRELPGRYMAKLLYEWEIENMIGSTGSGWRKIRDGGRKICSPDIVGICS